MIWTHNRSLAGQQGISSPVSLLSRPVSRPVFASKGKTEGSTLLEYTGLYVGLEHLKIETRLRDERFESMNILIFSVYYKKYRELMTIQIDGCRCNDS